MAKELKEERETNTLRIKTCFQSLAKGTKRRKRNQFLKNYDLLPIKSKRNKKENKKQIPYGLRLAPTH